MVVVLVARVVLLVMRMVVVVARVVEVATRMVVVVAWVVVRPVVFPIWSQKPW